MSIQLNTWKNKYSHTDLTSAVAKILKTQEDREQKSVRLYVSVYQDLASKQAKAKPIDVPEVNIRDFPAQSHLEKAEKIATQEDVNSGLAINLGDTIIVSQIVEDVAANPVYSNTLQDSAVIALGKTLTKAGYNYLNTLPVFAGVEVH